jgi:fructosamine-3-kinase
VTLPSLPPHLPRPVRAHPLRGGDIASLVACELEDGSSVVVKSTSYDATMEAEGLDALRDAGAPVPAVLDVRADRLVLERVSGPADWAALGEALAATHRTTSSDFGWHRDNVIGSLPQPNPRLRDWPTFYVEHRIRPFLPALAAPLAERLERACDGPLPALLDHDAPASLVHGDLWSGNIVEGRWLIDPAVNHADRELDLAMLALFGDAPDTFHRAYQASWPLDEGWQGRRPALQLYHLLVHVRLFGGVYADAVTARLDAIGC